MYPRRGNVSSRFYTSLTIDEIRWLNASQAFGEDSDELVSPPESVKAQSLKPKCSRPRLDDSARRSILLDDFFGSAKRSADSKGRVGYSRGGTSLPSSADEQRLPSTPPRSVPSLPSDGPPTRISPRPTEWLYRRPRSPSTLSRSPSSLSGSTSSSPSLSRTSSSSRSITPTPSRIRPPTSFRPRTPTSATTVTEMNQSPFWSTVAPLQAGSNRSPSGPRRAGSISRSSPNLLDFRALPRAKDFGGVSRLPIHRERSASESSSISTTSSTGSLPRTPPSPSIYAESRATTPTRSILSRSPKRSPSILTKHSSASKSVTFEDLPLLRFAGDRDRLAQVGDGSVRGEEWDPRVLPLEDEDEEDVFKDSGKGYASLKRFLTLRSRTKTPPRKPRVEISGPYALTPASHPDAVSSLGRASRNNSSTHLGVIPSSPNGGADVRCKKSPTFLASELGALPEHSSWSRPSKAASIAGGGSVGVPVLHALPSMESFRSVRTYKSARSCGQGRFNRFLGRIGIGVAA